MKTVENHKHIGHKIKKARIEKNMTQEDLANNHFHRSFLSQIEKGLVKPSDRVLSIIAERLNLPISYFQEPEDPDKDDKVAIQSIKEVKEMVEKSNFDDALKLLDKSLKKFDISPKCAGMLLEQQGEVFYLQQNYKKAISSFKKSKVIYEDHKYHHELCNVLNWLGILYMDQDDCWSSISELRQALLVIENHYISDAILILDVYYNLGKAYLGVSKFQEAINILTSAIELSDKDNNYYNYGELYYLLGQCYYGINNLSYARQTLERAMEHFVIFSNNHFTGKTQEALGDIEFNSNQPELAIKYYEQAYKYFTKSGTKKEIARSKLKLLKTYLQLDAKKEIIKLAPYQLELLETIEEKLDISHQLTKIYLEHTKGEKCRREVENLLYWVDISRRKHLVSNQQLLFYYSWLAHVYFYLKYFERGKKCLKQCNALLKKLQK